MADGHYAGIGAGAISGAAISGSERQTFQLGLSVVSYALTGKVVGLYKGRSLPVSAGSYALTGVATGLHATRRSAAVVGAYTLTGITATLRIKLPAMVGSYTLTGRSARLLKGSEFDGAVGAYALSGIADRLLAARRLAPAVGGYSFTGRAATLRTALPGQTGVYVLSGRAIGAHAYRVLYAGRFTVPSTAGIAAAPISARAISGGIEGTVQQAGRYSLVGRSVVFFAGNRRPKVQAIAS